MTALPRLLVLIGSGETAAHMARGHRSVVRRLITNGGRARDIRAALVDTPYGFQPNADSISTDLLDFFGRRLGMAAAIASFRRSDIDVVEREAAYARIRDAEFVFSGPGSPSYAVRQWRGTQVPQLFASKLTDGGALVLASAAALTAGRLTVPVYELYKAGEDPHWLDGLDILGAIRVSAAVIPHYDNREGSDHDTRFCFLGEERLVSLEALMPDDVFILGIDEHTAVLVDVDAETVDVHGRGGMTIRRKGASDFYASGDTLPLAVLRDAGRGRSARRRTKRAALPEASPTKNAESGLALRLLESEAAAGRLAARSSLVEPLVDALLGARRAARANADYAEADAIRDQLVGLGIEITDKADGSTRYRLP